MICKIARHELALLVRNDLSPADAAAVRNHLGCCFDCQKLYTELQAAMSVLDAVNTQQLEATHRSVLPKLEAAGVNVKVIAAISEELFDHQPEEYRNSVLPEEGRQDLMFVSTGTRRMWPIRNAGPLADEYSLTSDWDNQWLTGGLEADVIAEAHLDPSSILAAVQRFANERPQRFARLQAAAKAL